MLCPREKSGKEIKVWTTNQELSTIAMQRVQQALHTEPLYLALCTLQVEDQFTKLFKWCRGSCTYLWRWKLQNFSNLIISELPGLRWRVWSAFSNWGHYRDTCVKRWWVVRRWMLRARRDLEYTTSKQFQWVSEISTKELDGFLSSIHYLLSVFDQSNQRFSVELRPNIQ